MILNNNIRLTGRAGSIRPAAVAGMFYPREPEALERSVRDYLARAECHIPAPKAIIAPHAGHIYSGPVAASVYASLIPARERIRKVVLLGPAHRVYLDSLALPDATVFATPLGDIEIDQELVRRIRGFPQVCTMAGAHAMEHSLEVHLPFLQIVLDQFTLLPLVVGDVSRQLVAEVLEAVWGGDETLIVISSDLSHYHDYGTAQTLDAATSDAIRNFHLDEIGPEQACGCRPMQGLLHLARRKNMEIQVLDVRNSGDTAGGRDQVVGYGAYAVQYRPTALSGHAQELLAVARRSIEQGFATGRMYTPDPAAYADILRQPAATFVTLKINASLRGCIGTTQAIQPLIVSVADSAYKAAFQDPRFKPLTREEYRRIELSVSVLTPPEEISYVSEQDLASQLQPGMDGLIIEAGPRRATFLPEVWDSIPGAEDFLRQLKLKAGMSATESPVRAWRYRSEHYSSGAQ
jgi:AmmeMemoRadiSam system protein B/AmmeMemoRadiSam system protein A